MLKNLFITNYALIDSLEIDFSRGLNIITGETGAGKSVLLGALSLILGQRADSTVLSDKSKKCIIEGSFDISGYGYEPFFAEKELDFDDIVVLRREISPNGKSRAFINDTPVNLELLKDFGEKIVDIHSQHTTLTLQGSTFQLDFVDAFIQHKPLLENYQKTLRIFNHTKTELESLIIAEEKAKSDLDYFQFQYDELESAHLIEDEQTDLETERDILTHAGEISTVIAHAVDILDNGELTVISMLKETESSLQKVAKYLPAVGELTQRLSSTLIELKDIASELESTVQGIHVSPQRLEELEARIDILYHFQQKHRVQTVGELITLKKSFEEKIANVFSLENKINEKRSDFDKFQTELTAYADQLSVNRQKAKEKIEKGIKEVLKKLAMPDSTIEIKIESLESFGIKGKDKINFLFNANKGGELKPIAKVASGGELSRLMLAIKSLITQKNLLPTIIFDEIDSGVSGEIAAKVGEILKSMTANMQVIVITHLPQIAGIGDSHFLVFKENGKSSTFTRIKKLNSEERIYEVARMLSGDTVSDEALGNAKVLIYPTKN
jgi:DNA repair protein RecN (Recombination protein N)